MAAAFSVLSLMGCRMGEIAAARGRRPAEDPGPIGARHGGPEVMLGERVVEPGRVVAHRLNRVEYDNTVRDLFFGLDLHPADAFPVDTFAEGFDNNAQELRMSNLLFEKYLEAAHQLVPRRSPTPTCGASCWAASRARTRPAPGGCCWRSPSGPSAGPSGRPSWRPTRR